MVVTGFFAQCSVETKRPSVLHTLLDSNNITSLYASCYIVSKLNMSMGKNIRYCISLGPYLIMFVVDLCQLLGLF